MAKCPKHLEGWDELLAEFQGNRIKAYQAVANNQGKIPSLDSPIVEAIKSFELVTNGELTEETETIDGEKKSTGYYVDNDGNRFRRTTDDKVGFIREFNPFKRNKERKLSYAEQITERRYKDVDPDGTLVNPDNGKEMNKEQFLEHTKAVHEAGRIKGLIIHKSIEAKIHPSKKQEIDDDIQDLLYNFEAEYGEGYPIRWKWINKEGVIEKMLNNIGVNVFKDFGKYPENDIIRDEVQSEVKVSNKLLGFGGTIDQLVKKANGKYSLTDWKTGKGFNPSNFDLGTAIMKYGEQPSREVLNTPMDKAKLQVLFYAFMLKINNPSMEFENLTVSWIPTRFEAEKDSAYSIDIKAYLPMIEAFMKDDKALKEAGLPTGMYEKVKKESPLAFEVNQYTSKTNESLEGELIEENMSANELLSRKLMRLEGLIGKGYATSKSIKNQAELRSLSKDEKEEVFKLQKDILSLQSDGAIDLHTEHSDINKAVLWMGNWADVSHPMVQEWKKYIDRQKEKKNAKKLELLKEFERKIKPLVDKEKQQSVGFRNIRNFNYERMYGKFYVQTPSKFSTKMDERFVTKNETDPELKAKYDALSTDEKIFIDFVNDTFSTFFSSGSYLNKNAAKIDGINYSHLDLFNKDKGTDEKFAHEEGFFFKVPIGEKEIKERFGWGRALRTYLKYNLTYFVENQFERELDENQSIPIRFLGNKVVNGSQSYSKDIKRIFINGTDAMLEKEHMDSAYALGASIAGYMRQEAVVDKLGNTAQFIDDRLFMQLQGKVKRLTKEGSGFKVPRRGGGHHVISPDKVLKALGTWASMTTMWLKPIQGIGNGVHATLLTHRDGLKGSISSKFLGIEGDSIDFTASEIAKAEAEYGKVARDTMFGKLRENKMMLMAQKFDYFGNNFDYATLDKFVMAEKFKGLDSGTFYMFHSVPEEFVSLTTMTAQMMHMKNKTTGESIWDSYEVKETSPGIHELVWNGGVRGAIKRSDGASEWTEELTELNSQEIAKLKRTHERLQGGYRKDEATRLEMYALGKLMIQFKKYFPRLVLNMTHGTKMSTDLGYYKQLFDEKGNPVYEDKDGQKIPKLEWHARVEEGRFVSLFKSLSVLTGFKGKETINDTTRENVLEAALTIGMAGIFLSMYLLLFADADEDDAIKKWWKMYLIDNLSQQYNVMDSFRTAKTAGSPVFLTKAYSFAEATGTLFVASANYAIGNEDEAFTKRGDLRGWNQWKKGWPVVASVADIINKVDKADPENYNWFFQMNDGVRLK